MNTDNLSKTAILVLSIGERDFKSFTLPSIQKYATRVGASLIIVDKIQLPVLVALKSKLMKFRRDSSACYIQKMLSIYELLNQYHKVLLLDDSCLVTDQAPNLFDLVPEDSLAAYPESDRSELKSHEYDKNFILKKKGIEIKDYFNTGVLLAPSSARHLFSPKNILKHLDLFRSRYPSQAYFNYVINEKDVNVMALTEDWNYMPILGYTDRNNRRLEALPENIIETLQKQNFIHITGYYEFRDQIIEQISGSLNSQNETTSGGQNQND